MNFLKKISSLILIGGLIGLISQRSQAEEPKPIPKQNRLAISETDVVVGVSHGQDEYGRFIGTNIYFSRLSLEDKIKYLKYNKLELEFLEENYTKEQIKEFGLENFQSSTL